MQFRWQSCKKIVRLWVDLFDRHNLLTYASAIALRTFIAAVACTLFSLGLRRHRPDRAACVRILQRRAARSRIGPGRLGGLIWAGHAVPGSLGIVALILRWPAALALVAVAFELIVRYALAKHRRTRWASFGSVLVVVGWIGETPPSKRRLLPLAVGVIRGEP